MKINLLIGGFVFALLVILFTTFIMIGKSMNSDGTIKDHPVVTLIDGCEYLVFENSMKAGNNYSLSVTHKGNCTNHAKGN
jgi:hypothetical protein